jgi:hypothetical protein
MRHVRKSKDFLAEKTALPSIGAMGTSAIFISFGYAINVSVSDVDPP